MFSLTSGNYRTFESYCEICAEVLNVLFYVSMTGENVVDCLSLEKTFSLFQWRKILDYNGIGIGGNFSKYEENSSVFSYYGLKSVGLYYLDDFIRTFWISNRREPMFAFKKTQQNIIEYCRFFGEKYFRKEYLQSLSNIGEMSSSQCLSKTLRMTLIEI
jgi:hypothetical protein